jgi:asparagine synthetase B (glutamine-hydrolysing)
MVSAGALHFPGVLEEMGEALGHRGPDGRASFTGPHARIGTARLRIIDLH